MPVRLLLTIAAIIALGSSASGQPYPARSIRMVVPFPAGSGSDGAARILAPRLSERLAQPLIIDHRPGATAASGTEWASLAAPDGYTLLLGSTWELGLYPALTSKAAYDVLRDFVPVALVSEIPFLLVVHPSLPARSLSELIALAKARPGQIRYGSAGNGATSHLTMALLCSMAGADMLHVPDNETSLAAANLLDGQVQVMMPPMPSVLPYTASGRLRPLAVSSARRWPTAPGLPTVAESGLPGYEVVLWTGLLAPANTPRDIALRLYRDIGQVLALPDVVQGFADQGAAIRLLDPDAFAAYIRSELEKWSRVGRQTGVRSD